MIKLALAFLLALTSAALGQMSLTGAGSATVGGGGATTQMLTPLLLAGGAVPSNAAVNYSYMVGAGVWNATAANKTHPVPANGTMQGLEVWYPQTVMAGSWALNFYLGSNKTVTCSLSSGQTCSDQNVHTDTVATSSSTPDLVSWASTPTTTPTAQTNAVQIGSIFTAGSGVDALYSPVFGVMTGNMSTTASQYGSLGEDGGSWNATETVVSMVMPTAGYFDMICNNISAAAGASASYTFTLFVDQQATALTNAISGASQVKGCTAGTPVHVVAGDTISIQQCPSNASGCPAGSAPTARFGTYSIRWKPDIAGEALLFDTPAIPSASLARYMLPSGQGTGTTVALDSENVIPYTALAQHYKKLTVAYCKASGTSANTRTTIVEAGAFASTSATGITTGAVSDGDASLCPSAGSPFTVAGNTLAQDTTHTYDTSAPVTDGTAIDIKTTPSASLTALAQFKISLVVVVGP